MTVDGNMPDEKAIEYIIKEYGKDTASKVWARTRMTIEKRG